ncbi:MAG: hypothetical protein A4S12_00270 [Proteobacteria bacterium SG_bin5]|nr:MAG: hypothetical protein A4S12_00270 [Proteobacteria bacterium SG_bin5]
MRDWIATLRRKRVAILAGVDHQGVMAHVRAESGWDGRYVFMTLVSAAIAILGLLLSSPAVVIGAMLISPLMGPIIGLGFGLATIDAREIRLSAAALVGGSLLAVGFAAAIVLVSPLQNVTPELAARTRPNLFDQAVALFSALAGAYATVRGRAGTVVGVAIATALMPPLATIGFGLATRNATAALGASLLFVTNLVTIAATVAVMARLYGFARDLSPRQTLFQSFVVLAAFLALAVPLGFSLKKVAWEGNATRLAREVIAAEFGDKVRLSQLDLDFAQSPLALRATVFTPVYRARAPRAIAARLKALLGQPVTVAIEQYRVGLGAAAEAAQLAEAQRRAAVDPSDGLAERIALIAGVAPDQVLLDREAHRAEVRAQPLPGAGLATYRALEARLSASAPGWQVWLIPPPIAPGVIEVTDDAPDPAALGTAIWAAKRLNLALALSGAEDPVAAAEAAITAEGVATRRAPGRGRGLTLAWEVPGAAGE